MGYTIRYGSANKKGCKWGLTIALLTLAILQITAVGICYYAPQQFHQVVQSIFPSDQFDSLADILQDGEGILDAVDAFCQDLLNGK